ncbi:MAG: hypothetical protein JW709_14220 [Sedimentisphaerales bacterium]|nr:hypothetical protein [Sedimentisphaerales bacterium]
MNRFYLIIAIMLAGSVWTWGEPGTYEVVILHDETYAQSVAYDVSGPHQAGSAIPGDLTSQHILVWNASPQSAVDVTPVLYEDVTVGGINDDMLVGYGSPINNSNYHALAWRSGGLVIDLHGNGLDSSAAYGIWQDRQVGVGYGSATGNQEHALLWFSTPDSRVDLHPVGFSYSIAYGVCGDVQVGSGTGSDYQSHALLWRGTAASVVDLHPAGYSSSWARGADSDNQVGYGMYTASGGAFHALLWQGTAESVVDLHPAEFFFSQAMDTAGDVQVGYGVGANTGWRNHALAWNGTADSAIDLHGLLGDDYEQSYAYGVNSDGVIVGAAYTEGQSVAVLWRPLEQYEVFDITLKFTAQTINPKASGKWFSAHITLPEGKIFGDVDQPTIRLLDVVPADKMDIDEEANNKLTVKFLCDDVLPLLQPGEVTMTVTGKFKDGSSFQGSDVVTVLDGK